MRKLVLVINKLRHLGKFCNFLGPLGSCDCISTGSFGILAEFWLARNSVLPYWVVFAGLRIDLPIFQYANTSKTDLTSTNDMMLEVNAWQVEKPRRTPKGSGKRCGQGVQKKRSHESDGERMNMCACISPHKVCHSPSDMGELMCLIAFDCIKILITCRTSSYSVLVCPFWRIVTFVCVCMFFMFFQFLAVDVCCFTC